MKRGAFFTFILLYSGLAFAISFGGNKNDFLKGISGHYEGSLSTHTGATFTHDSVKCDLDSDKKTSKNPSKNLMINDLKGTNLTTLTINKSGKKDLVLTSPYLDTPTLLKQTDDECYADGSDRITFCVFQEGVQVEILDKDQNPIMELSLGRFAMTPPVPDEPPQVFDLKTAVSHAWKMNFDDRIEFEHVIQAKYNRSAANLNKLPHISFNTIINLITPSVMGVIQSAGDLLPFLFPTRWLQAKKAGILSEAEQDTMLLLRMDTASQIEAAFYTYQNDYDVRELYKQVLVKAKKVVDGIALREKIGDPNYPQGSTLNAQSAINLIQQNLAPMDSVLDEDRATIAQVLGFYNPEAVSSVKLDPDESPITQAKPVDREALKKTVIDRSPELRQLSLLIDAAKNNKKQVTWNWLDPSGDPTMNLGFNLKSNLKVAASQIVEMHDQYEKMQQCLEQKAYRAATDYNGALLGYQISLQGLKIQKNRFDQIAKFQGADGSIDLVAELQIIVQDYLTDIVNAELNIMTFRTARARIDRLLLQGIYANAAKPITIDQKQ